MGLGYFNKKEEMRERANLWTQHVDKIYKENTESSILNSIAYGPTAFGVNFCTAPSTSNQPSEIQLQDKDSVTAAIEQRILHPDKKICVLNFASYRNPGGKFLEGSSAQEESLCHESNLYSCLREFEDTYYAAHRKPGATKKGLYDNEAIYLPSIIFEREGKIYPIDVITCAAPNWKAAVNYFGMYNFMDNTEALKSRIKFIHAILEEQKVDIVILGAFGCGVFGQDPREVATLFQQEFAHTNTISTIIYAIPTSGQYQFNVNYKVFNDIIECK